MSDLKANHEEATQLAKLKHEESNLARAYLELKAELDALKAQSAEPVYLEWVEGDFVGSWYEVSKKEYDKLHDDIRWCLYSTQPTATALVADFKQRAVEVCMNKAKSVTQLNYAGGCEYCAEAIESLPLINFNQGEK